jgi:hypothetical protein
MEKDATINARIPSALRDEVNKQAARLGWRSARIVREALEHYLPLLALAAAEPRCVLCGGIFCKKHIQQQ